MKRMHGCSVLLLVAGAALAGSPQERFGVIDIEGHPHPQFIHDDARRGNPAAKGGAPVFLHVPREHSRHWPRFCRLYAACERPAFFVSEEWYYGIFLGKARAGGTDPEDAAAGFGAAASTPE